MKNHDQAQRDPLVAAEVDLSGMGSFMLDVQRLLASELMAISTGDEFKAAVTLWCKAWQQIPPGSLPNNERLLAAFSGAGVKWRKVREVAMRGFIECSDGRLYHKKLCEDVNAAWVKRQKFRDRVAAATEARRNNHRNDRRNDDRNDDRNGPRDECRNGHRNEERYEPSVAGDSGSKRVLGQELPIRVGTSKTREATKLPGETIQSGGRSDG